MIYAAIAAVFWYMAITAVSVLLFGHETVG